MSVSPTGPGSRPTDGAASAYPPEASIPNADEKLCACGAVIPKWWTRCYTCLEQRVIDAAEVVEPSSPLCIVADDRFFGDIEDAIEECPGQFAHPCEEIPLAVNPKRCAADLAERVIEEMCEEAFEDAADYVNGERELIAAFEAALEAFNAAQTANSWMPLTKKVFRIPKSESVHENATGEAPDAPDAPDIHP